VQRWQSWQAAQRARAGSGPLVKQANALAVTAAVDMRECESQFSKFASTRKARTQPEDV